MSIVRGGGGGGGGGSTPPPQATNDPPARLVCPITQDVMDDPVMDAKGHNFDRASITAWLTRNSTCPLGREPVFADRLIPNIALKEEIEEWKSRGNQPPQEQQQQPQQQYHPPPHDPNQPWLSLGMEQEEYDRVMCMFMTFDTDGSGELNRSELRRLCKYMNYPNREEDIAAMFMAMDTDRSGSLSFEEFVAYMKDKRPKPEILYGITNEQYQAIMMLFHMHDSDENGELDLNEFKVLSPEVGYSFSSAEIKELFQRIDTDHSGRIDLHEFLTYMHLNHPKFRSRRPSGTSYAPNGASVPPVPTAAGGCSGHVSCSAPPPPPPSFPTPAPSHPPSHPHSQLQPPHYPSAPPPPPPPPQQQQQQYSSSTFSATSSSSSSQFGPAPVMYYPDNSGSTMSFTSTSGATMTAPGGTQRPLLGGQQQQQQQSYHDGSGGGGEHRGFFNRIFRK